jgi:hypothetical protein
MHYTRGESNGILWNTPPLFLLNFARLSKLVSMVRFFFFNSEAMQKNQLFRQITTAVCSIAVGRLASI